MPEWYEVFDDERGLRAARIGIGRRAVVFALGGVLLGMSAFVLPVSGGEQVALGAGLFTVAAAAWLVAGLRDIRDRVWCTKISARRVIGYDLTQQRVAISWPDVDCVEIDRRGLLVRGRDESGSACRLRIAPSFPDYTDLSHRFVDYAELHARPLYLDGRPWQLLDLHAVFPFLGEAVPAPGPEDDDGGEYVG
jgi:hypothetical protein